MTTILNTEEVLAAEAWEKRNTPSGEFLGKAIEASKLFNEGMSGRNPFKAAMLKEALTRADFNLYLGKAFDIEMLAKYEDRTPEWQKIATPGSVKDFKPKTYKDLFGGRGPLDKVGEGQEYKERNKDAAEYELQVAKFGNTFKLTFELIKNDELDGLRTLPDDLAQGAIETEDKVAFESFVSATGPNAAFFNAGNGNAPTTLAFTRENIQAAYLSMSKRKDANGNRIRLGGARLQIVVPVGLLFEAEQIVNAPTIPDPAGGAGTIPNPLAGKFTVVVSDYLTVVNTSAKADATWYILPAPTSARPALVLAKMRGEENPDIRVKADTGSRLGGGSIAPEEGSFNDDTITYRGRHIVGAGTLDPILTYASVGS
jgi:hypothetical protein